MQKYLIIFAFAFMGLVACSPIRIVSTDVAPRRNMSQYKTFGFAEIEKRVTVKRANSEAIENYIRQAVVSAMVARGYQLTDDKPDLLVDLDLNLLDFQTEDRSQTRYFGRRIYYYNYTYGYEPYNDFQTDPNWEASITLIFADAGNKQKLGEGIVETQLARKSKKSIDRLDEAVDRLLTSLVGEQ